MATITNIDFMMTKRKISLVELTYRVHITPAHL